MTMARWTDERLDKLADDVRGNTTAITELRTTAELLLSTATLHQNNLEVSQRNFEVIIGEIQVIKLKLEVYS
jgi:hypothetical protein